MQRGTIKTMFAANQKTKIQQQARNELEFF